MYIIYYVYDFKANENLFNLFSIPFSLSVEGVSENIQMEIINLQSNTTLKDKYNNVELSILYSKCMDTKTHTNLRNNALKITSLFSSTYTCEHIFSQMKIVQSKTRTRLTDTYLENSLRIALSQIQSNIDKFIQEKQCQILYYK